MVGFLLVSLPPIATIHFEQDPYKKPSHLRTSLGFSPVLVHFENPQEPNLPILKKTHSRVFPRFFALARTTEALKPLLLPREREALQAVRQQALHLRQEAGGAPGDPLEAGGDDKAGGGHPSLAGEHDLPALPLGRAPKSPRSLRDPRIFGGTHISKGLLVDQSESTVLTC